MLSAAPYRYVAPTQTETITTPYFYAGKSNQLCCQAIHQDCRQRFYHDNDKRYFFNVTGSIELDSAMQNVWHTNGKKS